MNKHKTHLCACISLGTWVHQNYTGCNTWPKIACSKVFNWLTVRMFLSRHSVEVAYVNHTLYIKREDLSCLRAYCARFIFNVIMWLTCTIATFTHEIVTESSDAMRWLRKQIQSLARDVPNSSGPPKHVGGEEGGRGERANEVEWPVRARRPVHSVECRPKLRAMENRGDRK